MRRTSGDGTGLLDVSGSSVGALVRRENGIGGVGVQRMN
jgi:hypothetical protein